MHPILAYIDPGAGSLVLQALIAGALSASFLFRRAVRRGVDRVFHRSPETEVARPDRPESGE